MTLRKAAEKERSEQGPFSIRLTEGRIFILPRVPPLGVSSGGFNVLVLSRHVDEVILIDISQVPVDERGFIEVMLTGIRPGKAKLGFRAPASAVIHRKEVFHKQRKPRNGEGQ